MAGTSREKWSNDFHPVDGAYRQRFSRTQCFFTPVSTLTEALFKKNSSDWDTAKSPDYRKKKETCKQTAEACAFFYMT
jgi:hypothetical protein